MGYWVEWQEGEGRCEPFSFLTWEEEKKRDGDRRTFLAKIPLFRGKTMGLGDKIL